MSKIEIRNLYLIFGKEKHKAEKMLKEGKTKEEILKVTGCTVAVKDANLSINEGEIFVIMGLSGSGKSTLLRCINRLIRPTSGEIIINDTDISKASKQQLLQIRRKELAMVFQHFGLLPHRSVLHNIAFGLELQGVFGTKKTYFFITFFRQKNKRTYSALSFCSFSLKNMPCRKTEHAVICRNTP